MAQVYNLSTWKVEARTLQVLGQPELYRRPYLKKGEREISKVKESTFKYL